MTMAVAWLGMGNRMERKKEGERVQATKAMWQQAKT
jgi:hypothetical protein